MARRVVSICVAIIPVLPNGKVNRKALLPPDSSELLSNYVAPTNEVERTLCEAFAQVLGMEQVGTDDDFFMLGGDSIKVMRLQQACESLNLTSKMIYKGKTPRHIAELCDVPSHRLRWVSMPRVWPVRERLPITIPFC